MTIKTRFSACFLMLLIFSSCGEDTAPQQEVYQKTYDNVMHVHDKLMVRMKDIYDYSKALEQRADTSAAPQQYLQVKRELQEVDSEMMSWMGRFADKFVKNKPDLKAMSAQELEAYTEELRAEEAAVKQMESNMNASLQQAEQLIKD